MALFINEGGDRDLKKKQVIVPDKLVDRLKLNKAILGKYKDTDGYKRISAIVDDDYNKRSDRKDCIHNDEKTISFGDLKRIDHDMRHMNSNPNNLEYVLQGGDEMKNWANDTLKKERTSVKQVKQVPQVPKLQNSKLEVDKPNKDIKMGKASVRITEDAGYNFDTGPNATQSQYSNDEYHEYYNVMSDMSIYEILYDFYINHSKELHWEQIDPNMYQKALSEFTKYGKLIHFPVKYIYQWFGMMMRDTAKLRRCTELSGHEMGFPTYEIFDFFCSHSELIPSVMGEDIDLDTLEEYGYDEWSEIFYNTGFYDWMLLPDGSDAMSDYGLEPLERIISNYHGNSTSPEQTLVLINKMLDIVHCRGDLSSMFIVGGRDTLSQISEEVKKRKKVIFNESQLLILKEYYGQTVFNFDSNGDAYFKKDNWQYYLDFLESIGKYGKLPATDWNLDTIRKAIEKSEDYALQMNSMHGPDEEIEEQAMYDYMGNLLENRHNIDFSDYFDDPSILEKLQNFDEWLNNYRGYDDDYVTYIDEQYIRAFLNDELGIEYFDDLYNALIGSEQDELESMKDGLFLDRRLQYGFPDDLTLDKRGLIYVEREISIPVYNSPEFKTIYKDFFRHLKVHYDGVGECWSWAKGNGEAYCGEDYAGGSTSLLLRGWVDPKCVNWDESLYRNCYSLNYEVELYLSSGTPVEIERAEIDGRNILTQPIIVNT